MGKRRLIRTGIHVRVDGNNSNWDRDGVFLPTKDQIIAALEEVPGDAYVMIKTHEWWWPRWNWTIRAWWQRGGGMPPATREEYLRNKVLQDLDLSQGNG